MNSHNQGCRASQFRRFVHEHTDIVRIGSNVTSDLLQLILGGVSTLEGYHSQQG